MTTKIKLTKIIREKDYLYYIDKMGNVSRKPMKQSGIEGGEELVFMAEIVREKGMMYFLDKDGDVACAPLARGAKGKRGGA